MNHGRIGGENRGFHRWMSRISETPTERDLNDIFEVQLNFISAQSVGKSIERFLQLGFKIFENGNYFFNSRLIDYTARSIDEETNVFVKFNVWRQFHRFHGLSHKAAARTRNFRRQFCLLLLILSCFACWTLRPMDPLNCSPRPAASTRSGSSPSGCAAMGRQQASPVRR